VTAAAAPRRRSPLRRRGFALLWAGGLVSDLGDWTLLIGLPVFVFQLTGSALTTSTIFVAELIPALVVGQVGGVLVDRWDRRRILVVASVLQAVLLLPLLAVGTPDQLWIVYLVATAQSGLARLCAPATAALIPAVVPPDQLATANGLGALSQSLARLLGAPLGGLAIQVLGLGGVVAADMVTFLVAAALVAAIPATAIRRTTPGGSAAEPDVAPTTAATGTIAAARRFGRDWVDGWRTIVRVPGLGALVGIGAVSHLSQGNFVVLYVVFVLQVLHADDAAVGVIRGMQAVGGLVGGLAVGVVAARLGTRTLVGWGFIVFGLLSLAMWNAGAVTTAVPFYATMFAILGLPAVAVTVGLLTVLQALTPATHLGRVYAAYETSSGILQAVGVVVAGALADRIGVGPILDMQALLYVGCGVAALLLLRAPLPHPRGRRGRGGPPFGAGGVRPGARTGRPARLSGRQAAEVASARTGSGSPASAARAAALSVRSHGRSRSARPKWPYAAVWR
jgi:MFS family permease